uniref:Uncharacterized protein n=1 Tax=Arundo donax TaxID=35708 RepID=A0A0A8ZTB2_ARUDO
MFKKTACIVHDLSRNRTSSVSKKALLRSFPIAQRIAARSFIQSTSKKVNAECPFFITKFKFWITLPRFLGRLVFRYINRIKIFIF